MEVRQNLCNNDNFLSLAWTPIESPCSDGRCQHAEF